MFATTFQPLSISAVEEGQCINVKSAVKYLVTLRRPKDADKSFSLTTIKSFNGAL